MRTRRGVSTTAIIAVIVVVVIIAVGAFVLVPKSSTTSTTTTTTSSSTSSVTSATSTTTSATSTTSSSPTSSSASTNSTVSNSDAALYQQALKEGSVTIYGSPTAVQFQNITSAFMKVYPGISINYTSEQPPQAVPLVEDQLQAQGHSVDLLLEAATTIYPLEQKGGVVSPYVSPYASQFPKAVLDPLNQSTPIIELAFGWAYNTNLISAANVPTTMAQVANSQFKGEVVMNDPTTGTAFTQYWASLANYLGNSTVYTFLNSLKNATDPEIVPTTTSCMNDVASGTYAICLGGYMQDAAPDIQLGSPLKFLNITGLPLMITPSDAAVVKNAQDPAAAQLLVDFMASPAGQTAWGNINVRTPVSQSVTAKWSLTSEIKTFDPGAGPQVYFPTPAVAGSATAWAKTFDFLTS
jgi:iron(III) transport system substrate-binding protein